MIFDGHGDIWTHVAMKRLEQREEDIFRRYHYRDFKAGGVTGGIFAIWIEKQYMDRPKERFYQIVGSMKDELEQCGDILKIVRTYGDFESAAPEKITAIIGTEGLSHIEGDVSLLDEYYEKHNIRHAGLTWNETNELATCWKGDQDRGLTDAGKRAVKKMEALGMLLDVSHLNDASFWDIVSMATKPFVASHSNVRALRGHLRNLDDSQIKAIAQSGGLVGMNSYGELVDQEPDNRTLERLCDHACYVAELVGTKHMGLGFDFMYYLEADSFEEYKFDSGSAGVYGLGYVGEVPDLIQALRGRGFSQAEIEDICYNNYRRIFKEVLS